MATRDKLEFLRSIRTVMASVGKAFDDMDDLRTRYFAAGYGVGGAREFSQQDFDECMTDDPTLQPMDLADVASFINYVSQNDDFIGNVAPLQGDRKTLISKLRNL